MRSVSPHLVSTAEIQFGSYLVYNITYSSDYSFSTYDLDNYLCTLLLPNDAQRGVFALRAFNVELAKIRESVRDVNLGRMRFQWWRDVLTQVFAVRIISFQVPR